MTAKFTELAGYSPDDASDIGIRIRVLAGEIYSVCAAVDWLQRQTFTQTATGSELELRAQERGITRKGAVAAAGTLTFGRSTALWYNAQIPAGTVCCTVGSGAVQYVTTQDAVLPQGSLTVDVPAKAETAGAAGNAESATITVMVAAPAAIETVTNQTVFTGGENGESDDSLRARLLECYAQTVCCGNAAWYRQTALSFAGVHSANVVPRFNGAGTVAVYLGGEGCAPSAEIVQQVQDSFNESREIGVDVTVAAAQTAAVDVTAAVTAKSGQDADDVHTACVTALKNYFAALGVGEAAVLSAMGAALFSTGVIADCSFSSSGKTVNANQLCVCGTVTVTVGV